MSPLWGGSPQGGDKKKQRRCKEMNGRSGIYNVARPGGNSNMDGVFGLEQLERKLSMGIYQRMKPFHYDELIRCDGVSRVRAVRCEDGRIDVMATFMKVRK